MPNHKIICAKSEIELTKLKENSIDSCVTDPPYELSFMNRKWDSTGIAFNVDLWKEVFTVLKPGAHLLAFGGTRTYHRMVCAIEDAGFEIRDMIEWFYGGGFPKSLDISKSIDKMGKENTKYVELSKELCDYLKSSREKRGLTQKDVATHFPSKANGLTGCVWNWENGMNIPTMNQWNKLKGLLKLTDKNFNDLIERVILRRIGAEREVIGKDGREANNSIFGVGIQDEWDITAPKSEQAIQWDGWGTGLKPAHEPILLARKPISEKNIAANILKWGVGGVNVDGCRISTDENTGQKCGKIQFSNRMKNNGGLITTKHQQGRFPANLILGCCCKEDELIESKVNSGGGTKTIAEGITSMSLPGTPFNYGDKKGIEKCQIHTNPNCICGVLDKQSGGSESTDSLRHNNQSDISGKKGIYGKYNNRDTQGFSDRGGASRFFYQAKASQSERWFYCKVCKRSYQIKNRNKHIHNAPSGTRYKHLDFHPTQKPIQLIQYLIKLITPPNGTVIDPFLGSGTGLIAAEREKVNCIGIDNNQAYCNIAHQRLEEELKQTKLTGDVSIVSIK